MTDEEDLPLDVRDAREMMVLDDIPTTLPYSTENTITRPLTEPELVEQLWRLACAEAIIQEHGEPRESRRPRDPPPRDDQGVGCSTGLARHCGFSFHMLKHLRLLRYRAAEDLGKMCARILASSSTPGSLRNHN